MEASAINPFHLCWEVILQESKLFNDVLFENKHCKLLDSRDANFDEISNRLAYTYMHGAYNIVFVQKCISKFFSECFDAETFFPFENLRVCSLSNGPGLDIVGLLCALCSSNKCLKCFPQLKAINLYESWSNLYKSIIRGAYEITSLQSYVEYFHISSDNVCLIQGDVFSVLSEEARKCITESNVLLMVKVYVSSKATPKVFADSLKEIFSLLQPGSLIFFVGSKNNTKQFSKNNDLSSYVKCIYGPQKVSIASLPFDKNFTISLDVEPHETGYAEFIVWQRKNVSDIQECTKAQKRRTRRKKAKNLKNEKQPLDGNDNVTSECNDDIDVGSEMSSTSASKQSDTLSDELKCDSSSSVSNFISSDEIKTENSDEGHDLLQNDIHSIDNITSILYKISIENSNNEKMKDLEQKTLQAGKCSTSSSLLNIAQEEVKFEPSSLENKIKSKILNRVHSKETKNGETESLNFTPQIMKESINRSTINMNFTNAEANSTNEKTQTHLLSTATKNKKHEMKKESTRSTKQNDILPINKTKQHISKLNINKETSRKHLKVSSQQNVLLENQFHGNLVFEFERSKVTPSGMNIQDLNKSSGSGFNTLLERCESLVTSLEKLTDEIKNISSNHQNFIRKCCYTRQTCQNRIFHHCPCLINTEYVCSNCRMTRNSCAQCRSNIQELQTNVERSTNLSSPYITIPLQNQDIAKILNLR